jgi:hypothetical protein
MPFVNCIAAALADQLIDSDRAQEMRDFYAQTELALRQSMTPHEAAAEAGRQTFIEFERGAAERRRQTFLTLAARDAIAERLNSFKSYWRSGTIDPYLGATGLYDRLLPNRNGLAVEQQREFWRGQAHAEMDRAFAAYRRTAVLGRQRVPANELNIVAEAFGRDTGDAEAKAMAQGWIKARELLRAGFNRFGGHIDALDDYGFPTHHSQRLVNAVSRQEWESFVLPLLDHSRMMTRSGARRLTGAELHAALIEMHRGITTQNWDTRDPSQRAAAALANRRDESRFLHFASPEYWLAYQRRFGDGNVFDTMVQHIDGMSRDIAHMQVMGPNPAATVAWLKNELTRRANLTTRASERRRATIANYRLDNLYAQYYSGAASNPVSQFWAETEGDLRNVVGSALLGSAVTVAVPTDWNFSRMTRAFNGLPQIKSVMPYLRTFNPASQADRMLALRLGLTAEGYGHVLHDSARAIDQLYGHQWSRWLVDRTLTWSGLTPHTNAARWAHGWVAQGALAQFARTEWRNLDSAFREGLQHYRIDEAAWNEIRDTPLHTDRGATFLRPGDIMKRTDIDQARALDLGQRVADWIMTETEFAVPSTSLAGRAIGRGAVRPGTVQSFFLSSPLMFKTFALTYLLSHGRRLLAQASWAKRLQYLASILIMNTLAGGAILQTREIANGRNPRDMQDWRFWASAFFAGGSLGLVGDFLYSKVNDADRGFASYLAGPTFGALEDVGKTAISGANIVLAKNARARRNAEGALANNSIAFVKRYLNPFGLFTPAIERAVFDRLQAYADPNWQQRLHRIERWHQRQFHQSYWWRRGETVPSHLPDLHAATGERK